ncbi:MULTISPECIES: hypothetical protein [Pseudonocardia]|uniref:Beta-lactamase enzyme family protein n=2 Tax=Pseudonocardia TaxID=1847 RepID=A0A1Y2MLV8_PSEAH|nr:MULTISPECIES: hypothetical protein [Pseudonocardia]OSY36132.1 hypothetical protein BG845_05647 [Pseudonocardia autotrophica]TDN77614.1 hypothetical protein C8E95_6864 [Pseudonocardia autotrophica]BBG01644.1 hypothetical protein Pdca_28530 [Pseudonocardia autotrophica]GEC25389.1 hypothetical protein PSA01_24180 [Pseudonocardia saturnea]
MADAGTPVPSAVADAGTPVPPTPAVPWSTSEPPTAATAPGGPGPSDTPAPPAPYIPEPQVEPPVQDPEPAADDGGAASADTGAADPVRPPALPGPAGESAASALLGTTRDLFFAMTAPDAGTGFAPREAVDLPPGTLPVAREDEDDLQLSWALLDTATGRWTGSADADSTRTEAESTIKAWLAADTLRAAAEAQRPVTDDERADIAAAVRASDDSAAERLYRRAGREDATDRLAAECGVSVATSRPGWWSFTQISAVDAAAILACVRDRAPDWPGGSELLTDLASITPDGRSGIHGLLPGAVAEKNGWTRHGAGFWNVNCVLAWEGRALAVLTSYPAKRDVEFGWTACRDVASDVLAADGVRMTPDVLADGG